MINVHVPEAIAVRTAINRAQFIILCYILKYVHSKTFSQRFQGVSCVTRTTHCLASQRPFFLPFFVYASMCVFLRVTVQLSKINLSLYLRVKYVFVFRIYFHVCILITAHFSFDAKIIFCHAVKSQQAFIYLLLSGMKVAKKNRHSLKQERKKTDGAKIYSNWLKQNRDVHIFIEYQSKS